MEVLCTKYLDARPLFKASLDTYPDRPPKLVPTDITDDTGVEVAGLLSGGAGMGGAYSVSLQHWLLSCGEASKDLRLTVAYFAEWLGNRRPHWAVYQALMSVRLIVLYKQPWRVAS